MAIENETEAQASGVAEPEGTSAPVDESATASGEANVPVNEQPTPVPEVVTPPAVESDDDTAESPAAESLAAESLAAESPAAESPAAESPAAESPAAESLAAESPAAESPAAGASGEPPAESAPPAEPALSVADASTEATAEAEATVEGVGAEGAERKERRSHSMRPAITAPTDIGEIADDLTADDFAAAVDRTVFEFKEGDIVAGTVVRVDPDEALIDIGYKSEGVIPANELSIRNSANPAEVVSVGDEIEALVMQKEDESGRLVLSKKRAQYERAWGRIEGVMDAGGTVSGPVIEVVKGGLIVDIGLRGFLPASLVDLRRVRDLHPFVGEVIEAKVIELDKNRNNVVLSRRAYLEEAQAEQRQAFLSDLQPGDLREGVVSSVVNFGAFVDLGGMDGLVHVSELSWQHVSHPSEVVNVGDKVQVKVLEVDRDRERISLSIRQTKEDPWDRFVREVEPGSIIDGEVTKTVPFGAFVSVGDGVEGLVHVSEIAIHHVESPELELSIGQALRVKVTEVDVDRRRVSLSIKQALPEWEERSQWSERRRPEPSSPRPRRREFQREEEASEAPAFNADASLEAILQELKERGIGRK